MKLYLFVGVSKYLKVSPKFYPLSVAVRYVPSAEAKRSLGHTNFSKAFSYLDDGAETCDLIGGESSRLPPMWPGFETWCQRHMLADFLVGSLLCSERFFSGYSGFPLSLKTNVSKFQFDLECTDTFQRVLKNS